MPRHPKPWFRAGRGWYIQRDGKKLFLGTDKSKAFQAYHELMRAPAELPQPKGDALALLVDRFLEWVQTNRAEETYIWYRDRLQSFCSLYPTLRVGELKPHHVQSWIDAMQVANGTKRNFARSIMRCMNWAEEQGYLARTPLAHFKKPRGGVRQTVITEEMYQSILSSIRNKTFRDLCVFAWETGARAMECLALEARHVELQNGRVVFPVDEEKMERAARVIYLSPPAIEVVERLMNEHTTGRLFCNTNGKPWTTEAVNCAFVALQIRMGNAAMKDFVPSDAVIQSKIKTLKPSRIMNGRSVPKCPQELREEAIRKIRNSEATKQAPKFCLTAFRHSFCHRLLRKGVDALTVSNLMGHEGISMVAKVYSHMNHAPDFLRESLVKAR